MKTQGNKSNRRQLKQGTFAYLDDLIFKWLLNVRSRNVVETASVLKPKAQELTEKINIKGFQASDSWLDCWKNRHNVSFKTVSGEGNSCATEMTAPWKKTTLPKILSKYRLDKIYNADEFGLFFRMQPNKSLNLRSEIWTGGGNKLKFVLQQMQWGIKYRCFSWVNKNPLAVSKELNTYLAYAEIKIKAGWIAYCLKSEYGKWIQNLQKRRKK